MAKQRSMLNDLASTLPNEGRLALQATMAAFEKFGKPTDANRAEIAAFVKQEIGRLRAQFLAERDRRRG